LFASVTQSTPSRTRTSVAAAGARKKNGFAGSGQRSPRSAMQHSRLSTKRSASRTASTTRASTSDSAASRLIALATLRPSIVSPARASLSWDTSAHEQYVAAGVCSHSLVDVPPEQPIEEAVFAAADHDRIRVPFRGERE
jgi:hypothetical protein